MELEKNNTDFSVVPNIYYRQKISLFDILITSTSPKFPFPSTLFSNIVILIYLCTSKLGSQTYGHSFNIIFQNVIMA